MDESKKQMNNQEVKTQTPGKRHEKSIEQSIEKDINNQYTNETSNALDGYQSHEESNQSFQSVKNNTTAVQDLLESMGIKFWKSKMKAVHSSDKKDEINEHDTSQADKPCLNKDFLRNTSDENLEEDVKESLVVIVEEYQEIIVKENTDMITSDSETVQENVDTAFETIQEIAEVPVKRRFKRKLLMVPIIMFLSLFGFRLYIFMTEPKPPNEDVVATYNGKNLTKDEILTYINNRSYMDVENGEIHPIHDMEAYRQVIKMMAVQNIVDDWAKEMGIAQKDEVKHDFKHLVEEIELDNLVDKVHQDQLSPEKIDKWEVQRYYDENKDIYKDKPFSEVEEEIRNILTAEKDKNFFPEYIEKLKKNAALNVNYDVLKVAPPTETEMRSFYEKNKEKYFEPQKAKILEIKIDISGSEDEARRRANEALTKIRSGESYEDVAKMYSNSNQLDAYYVWQGEKELDFEEKIFNLQINEISPVFKVGNSFYIVKVIKKQNRRMKSFGEALNAVKVGTIKEKEDKQYNLRKNEALFSIHGKTFTLGEFKEEFDELPPEIQARFAGFEGKKELIDQLIAKQLLLESTQDNFDSDESNEEIEELKNQYIRQILHKEEIDEKMDEITEEEIKKSYEENKEYFIEPSKVQISLIIVEQGLADAEKIRARQQIDEAMQRIKVGDDFAAVAKKYSNDMTASVGGELNEWIYDDDYLDPLLKKKIFSLQIGEVSDVFEYAGGYYIFKLRQKEDERQKTFEEVRDQIKESLMDKQHHVKEAELEDELLKKSQLVIYNSSLRTMLKEQRKTKE